MRARLSLHGVQLSAAGDLVISTVTRPVTTHTRDGASTEPHGFVQLLINTPNGPLLVDVDAGDFSRALAHPGTRVGVTLDVPGPVTRSA